MKILIFSPIEMPFIKDARYVGIERLAQQFAGYLSSKHKVTLLAHKDTLVPENVTLLPSEGYNGDRTVHAEQKAFQQYQSEFYKFDVIHDWGHLHLIARYMVNLPIISMMNNAPEHHPYPKAPFNLVSWSKWGVGQIRKYYRQEAKYQEPIVVDPAVYYQIYRWEWDTDKSTIMWPKGRGERFLTLGRMHPDKGNLNAIMLCKKLGLPLDVVGGRGSETTEDTPERDYEREVRHHCDGKQIVFRGEVTDEKKIAFMQTCKALIYMTDHAEITSHKVQEAMFCGAPVIIPNIGGLPEIVKHGVNGFLCNGLGEYALAIDKLDTLEPMKAYKELVKKYSPETVISGWESLYREVANGRRWR